MNIIFYDDLCGICDFSVRLLSRLDKKRVLFFAPLNGETHQKYLGTKFNDASTIVYYHNGIPFIKSNAIIMAIMSLSRCWSWLGICYLIPRELRDNIYDMIAKKRRRNHCSLEKKEIFNLLK